MTRSISGIMLIAAMLFCVFTVTAVTNKQQLLADEKKTVSEKTEKSRNSTKNKIGDMDYDIELMLKYNQVHNYNTYNIDSPALEGGLNAGAKIRHNSKVYTDIDYKLDVMLFAKDVERSNYTLNSIDQSFNADLNLREGEYTYSAFFNFDWVIKPDWPDHYQPDPAVYDPAVAPDDIRLKSTDRFSYRKFEPGLRLKYRISDDFYSRFAIGITKKTGYTDSNYHPENPTHLTPEEYTAVFADAGLRFSDSKSPVNFHGKNRLTYLKEDEALARDRVTGITNYSTSPNPLYKELNNRTNLDVTFNINSIKMEITPGYSFEYNRDMYEGYYTYTGHTLGMELRHRPFKKIRYKLKADYEYIKYTDNGYGPSASHVPLKEGSVLYKKYTTFEGMIEYLYNRELTIFADYMIKEKETNYPDYVPGSFPGATKNYDIDFSYDSYRAGMGVKYRL